MDRTMKAKVFHILQFAVVISFMAPSAAAEPIMEHPVSVDSADKSLPVPTPRLGLILNKTRGAKVKKLLGKDTSKRATNGTLIPEVHGLAADDNQSTDLDGQTERPANSSTDNSQTAFRRIFVTENKCCYPVVTSCCHDPLLLSTAAIRKQSSESMVEVQVRRLGHGKSAKLREVKSLASAPVLAARSVHIHRKPQKSSATG